MFEANVYKYLHNSAQIKNCVYIYDILSYYYASFPNATTESGTVFNFHIFCQHAPNYNFTFLQYILFGINVYKYLHNSTQKTNIYFYGIPYHSENEIALV